MKRPHRGETASRIDGPESLRAPSPTDSRLGLPILITAFLLAVAACARDPRPATSDLPALFEIPSVPLEAMDPAVRTQLQAARARLEGLLAAGQPESASLGEAFGELGRLYQAYDLPEAAIACYRNARRRAPDSFRWTYLMGYLLYLEGELEPARAALDDALRQHPRDAPTNLWAGHATLAQGAAEDAVPYFERALAGDPRCAGARFGLGEAARELGELEAAVEHYRDALEQDPAAVRVHYSLARALSRLGRDEEARPHFALAAEQGAARGGWAGCDDPLIAEVASLATGSAAAVLRASGAGVERSIAAEIAEYRAAIAQRPEDAVAQRALGSALWETGDAQGAIRHLRAAIELAPDDATIHYDLGFVLARTGDLERSERHLKRAVELHPDYAEAHLMLGTLYQRHGLHEPALAHYDRVLSRDPDLVAARLQRALTLGELGRKPEALADLRRLSPPRDPQERLNLASAFGLLGDPARAGEQLQELAEDPEIPTRLQAQAHFNLGMLALERGAPREAIPHFRAAGELAPDFEPAERGLREAERRAARAG